MKQSPSVGRHRSASAMAVNQVAVGNCADLADHLGVTGGEQFQPERTEVDGVGTFADAQVVDRDRTM